MSRKSESNCSASSNVGIRQGEDCIYTTLDLTPPLQNAPILQLILYPATERSTSLMSESRDETPDSLEVVLVPPTTMTGNVALLSRRWLAIVREDMQRLSERLNDPEIAKDIVLQALEETMVSVLQLFLGLLDERPRGLAIRTGRER